MMPVRQHYNSVLNPRVVDELKLVSQPDVIRVLFPGAVVRDRGKMPCPFRSDRNPSYSCFRSRSGEWLGKDFATGMVYDNIDLATRVFPDLGFAAAVDRLAELMLGRSAFDDGVRRSYSGSGRIVSRPSPAPAAERPAITVVSTVPLMEDGFPAEGADVLLAYSRSRGIDDEVTSLLCSMSVIRIETRVGVPVRDSQGTPIVGRSGKPVVDDGLRRVLSLPNGIGGISFREPDRAGRKGFKGGTSSFPSFFMRGSGRLRGRSRVLGDVSGPTDPEFTYDGMSVVRLSPRLRLTGVSPEAYAHALPYLESLRGRCLSGRDVLEAGCVIDSVSASRAGTAVVVEGLFDALSYVQSRLHDDMRDLVVLNGVGNIRHAVPFLASEEDVVCLFDHDLRSGAGMRAYDELSRELDGYCSRRGGQGPSLSDGSSFFRGYKDLNEWMQARRGLPRVLPSSPGGPDDGSEMSVRGRRM